MKKLLFSTLLLSLALVAAAQLPLPKEEIAANRNLSASNTVAYPTPTQKLSPAPAGKKPFYISHYGRHGSRYLTKIKDYDYAMETLKKADEAGKLTELGRDVLRRVKLLHDEAYNRWSDLTPLGGQQSKEIIARMMANFPEVFKGKANVDARSTLAPRCVLSMTHAVQQMTMLNPRLNITFNSTAHDMHYMNFQDKALFAKIRTEQTVKLYEDYCKRHGCWQRMVGTLFNDTTYLRQKVNGERLNYYLFRLAGSVQNTTLRDKVTLYDIFTTDELVENWRMENAFWFLGYGYCPLNGNLQPYSQRHLLRAIIEQADSCIALAKPGVQLRYGHETNLLPLACLMGLNGLDQPISDIEELEQHGWVNYRIYPMGCNIQLVFYRKNQQDDDVLVKVLLNEQEARLPISTSTPPYYKWKDLKDYYLRKLANYSEEEEEEMAFSLP